MTQLLFANDRAGQYPASWYAATATPPAPCAPLTGDARVDLCVVGGGYTGLSAALHAARAGLSVVLLEAHRVGFGASGRNGGQVGSGQRLDQITLEAMLGEDDARALWSLGEDAKALVRDLIAAEGMDDCPFVPGVLHADWTQGGLRESLSLADHMRRRYGYDQLEAFPDATSLRQVLGSPAYKGGVLDTGAGHIHPLRFAFGLARAAAAAGARIHEGTVVQRVEAGVPARVVTATGTVTADAVVLACNGYLGDLESRVAARVMPINNFIVATEPLGDRAAEIIARPVAVADSKFVVNYYRLSEDGRLLFGGGESYGYRFPSDIAAVVRKPMREVFPQLADVRIDHAWGGTLAITMNRLPALLHPAPGVWSASGYSGHGVALATLAGRMLAQAIGGGSAGFDLLARLPQRRFPGGARLRSPLLVLAMTWFSLRDRLGL